MLDQTFSAQNLRRIYDIENRRGRNVDRRFFPELVDSSARITAASAAVRNARRENFGLTGEAMRLALQPFRERLRQEREDRELLVESVMERTATEIFEGYQLALVRRTGPNGTALFTLPEDPRAFFIEKQIQNNVKRLYKLAPGNRRAIVSQLFDQLNTGFGQFCIRTDIAAFYESIDRKALIRELESDQLLSYSSKKYVKQALASFEALSQSPVGIPRGLGFSAFLSELYMRSVDERIRQLPRISYYARYVDDIIIVFSPTAGDDTSLLAASVAKIVAEKQLALNLAKTVVGATVSAATLNFDYLGYRFTVAGGACRISMGQKKFLRYRRRIDRAFSAFNRESSKDRKGAGRLLAARVKFMTSNTRLINNKSHAYVGIYFNNSHLTDLGKLAALDAYLQSKVAKLSSASLQDRLDVYSFQLGFVERRFSKYSTKKLAQLVEAWHYEA